MQVFFCNLQGFVELALYVAVVLSKCHTGFGQSEAFGRNLFLPVALQKVSLSRRVVVCSR